MKNDPLSNMNGAASLCAQLPDRGRVWHATNE